MNNNELTAYEIVSDMQNRLIEIEVALSNKTMSVDIAQKHIKQVMVLANGLGKQFKVEVLTEGIMDIAKDLLEKTRVPYSYASK